MTALTTPLEAALYYAARGWRVIPVIPRAKRPVLDRWTERATTDPDLIREWWGRWPDHGVGIVTGLESGIFVLDVDPQHGGDDTLADLEHEHGPLPDTIETITGGGGRHIIFQWPGWNPGTAAGQLGPGLDIRAEGGFIVAPPTIHPNGRTYTWELEHDPHDGLPPLDAPQWLLTLLQPAERPTFEPHAPTIDHDGLPDWHTLLTQAGATHTGTRQRRDTNTTYELWTRPGKPADEGCSATLGYTPANNLRIFTSNWPGYHDGEHVTRFKFYADLHHAGNLEQARNQLDQNQQTKALADLHTDLWPRVELPETPVAESTTEPAPEQPWALIPGGTFIHHQPEGIAARWGHAERILWAEGEALLIAAGPGVGKSTLTANLVNSLITPDSTLLDLPTKTARRILYLALDRPRQIARVLRQQLAHHTEQHLNKHLIVRAQPVPKDITKHPEHLLELARYADADVLIIDSLKDLIPDPADNNQGGMWNRAMQHCVAEGIDVIALHHNRKRTAGSDAPPKNLSEIYGSVWITAGAGSVIYLHGEPGDPLIELHHLKQPAETIGPLRIERDHQGHYTIESGNVDPLTVLRNSPQGITANHLAQLMFGKNTPTKAEQKKARNRLEKLVAGGHATAARGARGGAGGSDPDRYHHVQKDPFAQDPSQEPDKTDSRSSAGSASANTQVRASSTQEPQDPPQDPKWPSLIRGPWDSPPLTGEDIL